MTIRLSGLSSGLDTETLIKSMMELQRKPLYQLQDQNKLLASRKTDLGSLKSALFSLSTKLADLTYANTYSKRIATSSDETVATATAQNTAPNATYTLNVTAMATNTFRVGAALGGAWLAGTKANTQSIADLGVDGNTDLETLFGAGIANGSFYINGKEIKVDENTDTINTIVNKITASSAGVTASYDGQRITLTQKTVGSAPTIQLTGDTSGFLAATQLTGAVTAGTDADENKLLKDTAIGNTITDGYFSINGTFFSVDKNTDTLTSIIGRINQSSTAGVTAFFDAATKKITLTSKEAGNKTISLGTNPGTDTSDFLNKMGLDVSVETLGTDATATLNGAPVTVVDNKVTVNGVTFTINKAGTAKVTVANDVDATVEKVKAFVNQYNAVMDLINSELAEEKVKDAKTDADFVKGNLRADSLLVGIRTNLRSYVYKTVAGQPTDYQQLSQIGISTGAVGSAVADTKSGHLVLNETKLRSALAADPDSVATLFGTNSAHVTDEMMFGDGATTTFALANTTVLSVPPPTVKVGGTPYTLVSGAPSSAVGSKEYSINYTTGQITFGVAPANLAAISVSYDYSTTGGEGLASLMKKMVGELTRAGGTFDARIGSNGSITRQINNQTKSIENMERRLKMREDALYKQFANLETLMSKMNSQSSWLTAQLASLTSSSSSSKK